MDELIRYQVRVESGTELSFEMRQPRRLRDGDRFNWQGRSFQVITVRFHPDHPRQAVAVVKRSDSHT
jgi:urease accessory protein UreE